MKEDNLLDRIKSLTLDKKYLILLKAFVTTKVPRNIHKVHNIYNKNHQKEFNEFIGEDITRHRLHYLEMNGLLKFKRYDYIEDSGKRVEIILESNIKDEEWFEVLLNLGIIDIKELKKQDEKEIFHEEEVEKLQRLLDTEKAPKVGWKYLIKK